MGAIGGMEWIIIVLIVLLFFGAKKIPELARGLGQGITEFKKASSSIRREIEKGSKDVDTTEKTDEESEKESK